MKESIKHKWFFSQAPQEVWEYLTKAELMEQWLMKNDFYPAIGYQFQFRSNPIPSLEFDGIIYCTVLEMVPFKKLTYSWKSGPGNEQITLDSTVTWTLNPKDGGTELLLDHSGFTNKVVEALYNAMEDGWQKNVQKIAKLLITEHGTTNT